MLQWINSRFSSLRNQDLLKHSLIAMTLKLTGIGSSYIFILLITKNFGAEGWGKFSLSISFIMFCILLGKFGFDLAFLKFTSENEAKNNRSETKRIYVKGMLWCLSVSILLTIIVASLSNQIAYHLFKNRELNDFIFYSSFLIFLHVTFLINSEGLRGLKKNNAYLFIQYIGLYFIASIVFFILTSIGNFKEILSMQSFLISSIILFIISTVYWLNQIKEEPAEQLLSYPLKNIFRVSIPMMMSSAMIIFLNWTDTLLMGFYGVNESKIGIYSVALKVAGLINLPLLAVSAIIASTITENFTKNNMVGLQTIIKNSTKVISSISALIFILYLFLPDFFLGFFGTEFKEGSKVLMILSIGFLISSFSGCNDIILQMTGNEKIFKNIMIFATLLNITLNLALIPLMGIEGAAIASLCSVVFWNSSAIYYIKKRLGINSSLLPF